VAAAPHPRRPDGGCSGAGSNAIPGPPGTRLTVMDEERRAGDLGLEEQELAPLLEALSPGLVDALCEALVFFPEALDEVGT